MVGLAKSPSISPTKSSLCTDVASSPSAANTLRNNDCEPMTSRTSKCLRSADNVPSTTASEERLTTDSDGISPQPSPCRGGNTRKVAHQPGSSSEVGSGANKRRDKGSHLSRSNEDHQPLIPRGEEARNEKKRTQRHYVANLHFPLRVVGTAYTAVCILCGWIFVYAMQTATKIVSYPFTNAFQRAVACAKILNIVSYFTTTVLNPLWKVTVVKPIPKPDRSLASKLSYIMSRFGNPTKILHNYSNIDFGGGRRDAKEACSQQRSDTEPKRFIYVINHLSNADPWICSSAGIPSDTAYICKGDLFDIPIGGWALGNSGHLKIEFTKEKGGWGTKKGSIAKMMDQAREYVQSGRAICVYPEGVRNPHPNGPLGEFKIGFFNLAVETNTYVVPVAISGTEKMWPITESLFDSSRAYVSFGEPISAEGETAESLRDKTYKIISDMRDQHPDRLDYFQQLKQRQNGSLADSYGDNQEVASPVVI